MAHACVTSLSRAVSNAYCIACVSHFHIVFHLVQNPGPGVPVACLYPHPSAQIQLSSFQGLRRLEFMVDSAPYRPAERCGLLRREVQRAAVSPRHANFACLKRPRETALMIVQILLRHGLGAEQALGHTHSHSGVVHHRHPHIHEIRASVAISPHVLFAYDGSSSSMPH